LDLRSSCSHVYVPHANYSDIWYGLTWMGDHLKFSPATVIFAPFWPNIMRDSWLYPSLNTISESLLYSYVNVRSLQREGSKNVFFRNVRYWYHLYMLLHGEVCALTNHKSHIN
jgi:hypothetical protein